MNIANLLTLKTLIAGGRIEAASTFLNDNLDSDTTVGDLREFLGTFTDKSHIEVLCRTFEKRQSDYDDSIFNVDSTIVDTSSGKEEEKGEEDYVLSEDEKAHIEVEGKNDDDVEDEDEDDEEELDFFAVLSAMSSKAEPLTSSVQSLKPSQDTINNLGLSQDLVDIYLKMVSDGELTFSESESLSLNDVLKNVKGLDLEDEEEENDGGEVLETSTYFYDNDLSAYL